MNGEIQLEQEQNKDEPNISNDDVVHFDVPQYFDDLFKKYNLTDKGFDLREVLSSEDKKAEFLEQMKKEIEEDRRMSNLTKKELLKAVKSSWSPVVFTALWAIQGVVEIFGPKPPLAIISACRTAIFVGMTKDAVKLAGKGIHKTKD